MSALYQISTSTALVEGGLHEGPRLERGRLLPGSEFFEIATLLARLDHVARFIVNANHRIM
jgi:hypothetical protein